MIRIIALAAVALLCLGIVAQADVFDIGPGLTSLEMVTVGDPWNAPDIRYSATGYGAVNYTYRIGKFEVTAAQYCEFLNAVAATDTYGLYNTIMWTGYHGCQIQRSSVEGSYTYSVTSEWANRPVNNVSFWDVCRFANWMHNGQPTGPQDPSTTEDGAYTLNGYIGNDGRGIQRNVGAKWFIPSEDEWYKAAYYGGGTFAGYWDYPTQSNVVPSNQLQDPDPGNSANFGYQVKQFITYTIGEPYYRTNVGEFSNSPGAYGTFDQGGNVSEWNETEANYAVGTVNRLYRGGSFVHETNTVLNASDRFPYGPHNEKNTLGFRIAAADVPEPSSILVLLGGAGMFGALRRRRR